LPGYDEGAWWVQDIAASIPHRLLGPGEGRTLLDLCAAPGGKALGAAAAGWRVRALDVAESRLARLRENTTRTGLPVEAIAADLFQWSPPGPADAVLLDAPCSATGVFRRHPEVLHRVTARTIASAAELQARMLDRAATWVRPGGRLVYASCSLEPEEGERILANFLGGNTQFTPDPPGPGELPDRMTPTADGWVRVSPGTLEPQGGADGFFIARLKRN